MMHASDGSVPAVLTAVGGVITAVVPICLALIAMFSPKRGGNIAASPERVSLENQYGIDTSDYGDDLIQLLYKQNEENKQRMASQDRKIDVQDRKILALEEREDVLLEYIEDIKSGVEKGIYPPWPRIPR